MRGARLAVAVVAVALTGCAGPEKDDEAAPERAADAVSFSLSSGLGPSTGVELDRARGVLRYRYEWAVRDRVETAEIRPDAAAWRRFWTAVERLGVWRWKESYRRHPLPPDSSSWGLELAHEGRRIRTGGVGATPDRFGELVAALSTLAGGRDL